MKEIKAIIKPAMLGSVLSALRLIEGLPGITISEVKGFGKTKRAPDEILASSPNVDAVFLAGRCPYVLEHAYLTRATGRRLRYPRAARQGSCPPTGPAL